MPNTPDFKNVSSHGIGDLVQQMSLVLLHISYFIAHFYMPLLNAWYTFLMPLQLLCHFFFETSHCGSKVIHANFDFGADILDGLE